MSNIVKMFQFLIGTIITNICPLCEYHTIHVSIPYRYDNNDICESRGMLCYCMFQFLIGTIITKRRLPALTAYNHVSIPYRYDNN